MEKIISGTGLRARSKGLAKQTIEFVELFPHKRAAMIISDQLLRSALSIGANLAESKGAGTRADFKRFNEISLKSANETIYWLEVVEDANLVDKDKIDPLLDEVRQIARMIASGLKGWRNG